MWRFGVCSGFEFLGVRLFLRSVDLVLDVGMGWSFWGVLGSRGTLEAVQVDSFGLGFFVFTFQAQVICTVGDLQYEYILFFFVFHRV